MAIQLEQGATAKLGYAIKAWLCQKEGKSLSDIETAMTYNRLPVKDTAAFKAFMVEIQPAIENLAEKYSNIKDGSANRVMAQAVSRLADKIAALMTVDTWQNDAVRELSGFNWPDETSDDFKAFKASLPKPAKGEKAVVVTAGEEV